MGSAPYDSVYINLDIFLRDISQSPAFCIVDTIGVADCHYASGTSYYVRFKRILIHIIRLRGVISSETYVTFEFMGNPSAGTPDGHAASERNGYHVSI